MLDPWPRWVRAEVLTTGDLTIGGKTVVGEGTHAREVQRLLEAGADPAALARAGLGWLIVQRGTPGDMGQADRVLRPLSPSYTDADIDLYRIGGTSYVAQADRRTLAIAAHLLWAVLLLGSGAVMVGGSVRSRAGRERSA